MRASRRIAAGVAGLGLVVTLAGGTSVSAASPSPVTRLAHALTTLTSYRVKVTVSTNKISSSTLTIDVVRNGKSTSAHLTGSVTASTGTQHLDAVIAGSKVCIKIGSARSYQCVSNPQIAAQLNADPSVALTKASKTTTYSSTPSTKMINGVSCDGYAFKGTQSGFVVSGMLFIQHSSGLPCEDDVLATGKAAGVSTTATTKAVWSQFNEPLTIPSIK